MPLVSEWRKKCQYMLLINKVMAINKRSKDQIIAIKLFTKIWERLIDYWNTVRQQDNLVKEVLELVFLKDKGIS